MTRPASTLPAPTLPAQALPLRAIRDAQDGAAAIEVALIFPIFLTLIFGILDVGQSVYGQSVLSGAVEIAARSSALETADTDAADQMVEDTISPILPGATVQSTRASYFDYSNVEQPEAFSDTNADGECNNGEAFVDRNNSGTWDQDAGSDGNGGAEDVVLYTVTVTYRSAFQIPFMDYTWNTRTLQSTAVRKNQPFADQAASTPGTCV